MKLASRKSALWRAVVCALAAVLVTLGVLQYRWSKEISVAAASRMRADLIRSMISFRQDFLRELTSVAVALEPNYSYGADFESYAREFANWRRTTSYPGMVQGVYIWQHEYAHSQLLKIKSPGEEPQPVGWPAALAQLRAMTITNLPTSRLLLPAPSLLPQGPGRRPTEADGVGVEFGMPPDEVTHVPPSRFAVAEGSRGGGMRVIGFGSSVDVQHEAIAAHGSKLVIKLRQRGIVTLNGSPWMVVPSIPALVHPLVVPSPSAKRSRNGRTGWMIILLNQVFLVEQLFPELVARHFSGFDYEIAVVAGEKGDRAIYSSNPEAAKRSLTDTDDSISLFGIPGSLHPHEVGFAALTPIEGVASAIKDVSFQHIVGGEAMGLLPMPGVSARDEWELVVKNRRGSLEAAVAALRRRHLAISFGVLLVLATTMGILIRVTQQAQELARMQIDFVAGVSHELRTPLTVISSAADNIADGVVKNREQMAHYGRALKGQASQLRDLVDQILLFAATRDNRQPYSLRPIQVVDAVDLALQNTAELIRAAGFAVECHVSRDLPRVSVDAQALSRCLQNLITNAIKYGGDACWIAIEAETAAPGREVTVSVRDHGIGINQEELKHIFEPFYRATSVRDAQIHGNGLGLPVARSIAEAMGGHITVESEPGRGSSFTVCLPAAA
jgi:signal transduction histidine kinase